MNKLEGLPTIHYISLEESIDRRTNLENWFQKYNITDYVPHIFKRFEEYDYELVGSRVNSLAPHSKGPITSHFTLLKQWYETTDEPYTLIVEDDLSLETVEYWNFTWKEFFHNLPKDWNCIQLVLVREYHCDDYKFEKRKENDWCAAAYLIKREYIKLLLDTYYFDDYFNLEIENLSYLPIIEHLLFTNKSGVYCFPLFVEDCYNTKTSLLVENAHAELINGQGPMHHNSYDNVITWWKNKGYIINIENISKMEHIYQEEQFGENWFSYPNLYKKMVQKFPDKSKFVEIGSWKGKSSAFMAVEIANSNKNIEFYCIDTWKGSIEHDTIEDDSLYQTFIHNMSTLQEYHIPLRMTSLEASKLFENESLDFVFIDASHEYEDVKNDINAWLPKVKKGGIIAGHDYYHNAENDYFPSVKKAVNECFNIKDLTLDEICWVYEVNDLSENINDLKILFFEINKDKNVWEYNFIQNELLPNDVNKTDYYLTIDNIRNLNENFDVLIYQAREQNNYPWAYIPPYDDVLECAKKVKPKIIIQLSDEHWYEDLNQHNELGNYCDLFLRQYHHQNYNYTDNIIIIPLGYTNGCLKFENSKEYDFSFFGEIKSDRLELLTSFISKFSNFLIGTKMSKETMCEIYSKSIFVPCGRGNSSLNCFRLYEASINGAIPVVVGSQEEIDYTFKYEENPPWIFSNNWKNASEICKNLLNNVDELEKMQNDIRKWWINRLSKIKNKIKVSLINSEKYESIN